MGLAVRPLSSVDANMSRFRRSAISSAVLLAALLSTGVGSAQNAAPDRPPPTVPRTVPTLAPSASATEVVEAKPEVYYLQDKTGELVPVINFPLEEFERLRRLTDAEAAKPRKPDYRWESIEATGTADDRHARLQVKFTALVDGQGWIRVPLQLRGAVLGRQAQYQGPGKIAVQFDAVEKQYVVWIQGAGEKPHELTLNVVVPVERIAGSTGIRLDVPRAWSTSLSLKVAGEGVTAQVSAGAVLDGVTTENKFSTIRATGIGGDFQLTWDQAAAASRRAIVLLEANADVLALFDGRSVAYETQVAVNSFGGEFEKFQIRLPPATVLVDEGFADVEIVRLPGKPQPGAGEVYEVRRTAGPTKSLSIRLKALRSLADGAQQGTYDFGGFEVLGAVRQWGFLGIVVEGNWQVLWGQRNQVRQVDASPETFRGHDPTAVFEYFGRPYSLVGRIVPRETRVSVDPVYALAVDAKRVTLEATLPYRVGGAKVFAMPVELHDWQVDEVGPAEIVDVAALAPGQTRPLVVPLLQPSTGEFQIVLKAHRDLPAETRTLDLPLPYPQANVVGEALVNIRAADNVELSVRDAAQSGLHRQASAVGTMPRREARQWAYAADAADARFRADFRVLQRSLTVRSTTEAKLLPDGGHVKQRLAFVVAREPVDALEFEVAEVLTEGGRLDVKLNDESIPWVVLDDARPADRSDVAPRATSRIRVELPDARLGTFELTADFPLAHEPAVPLTSMNVRIPLLTPIDGTLREQRLSVEGAADLEIERIDEGWIPVVSESIDDDGPRTWQCDEARGEAVLGVRWKPQEVRDDAIVDRVWIQSVVAGGMRQERAVFRFDSQRTTAVFQLPTGAAGAAGLVNGVRADLSEPTEDRRTTLRLPRPAVGPYVVELRYRVDDDGGSFDPPRLEGAAVHNVYRQLIYASDTCLLQASEGYLPEYEWNWRGAVLTRRPLLSQAELETWVGARHETSVSDRAHAYLYSGFGEVTPIRVVVAKRVTLVLAICGGVLVLCWLLLYLPRLRHPAVLVFLAAAVAAAGASFPDIAPLVVQTAAVGAGLAFATVLLERNVNRRRPGGRAATEQPSANPRGSTRTRVSAPSVAPPSTATVDLPGSGAEAGGAA